ncbi:MAG: undecaprenyl-diphosphate phosphatase [Desulfobacterales bacterium]|nr:undecaprenyl-diphosphate phosphatase [Desulfobacterales bacterium]
MTFLQAIALGIIQGVTEFLPVSSSGHLVLFQNLLGLKNPELAFDVAVHMGTLAAVCIYFRNDIAAISIQTGKWLFNSPWRSRQATPSEVRMAGLVLAGSIPTAIMGIGFHGIADRLFSSVLLVGFMLIVTGFWMWFTRYKQEPDLSNSAPGTGSALLIGIAQGMAIIPGISRAGATIAAALYLGIDRSTAARFSFLLSIPAIAGAALLNVIDAPAGGSALLPVILAGAAAAAATGYAALSLLVYLVKKGKLAFFAPYCWLVGGLIVILAW